MTKRETAALAMRILAAYLLVTALISTIAFLLGLPALIVSVRSLASKSHYLRPNTVLMVCSGGIVVAWDLILSVLFWILSPRISRSIFAGPEAEEEVGRLDAVGWISTFVLLLGVRLLILSLCGLCGGLPLIATLRVVGFSSAGTSQILEMSRYLTGSLANGLAGLFLLLGLRRVVNWTSISEDEHGSISADLALLGLRLLAIHALFCGLQSLAAMISPQLVSKAMEIESLHTPSFDWRIVAFGTCAVIISALPALLLWRLAPRLSGLLNRRPVTET
jgi:hypothetical protein